MGCYHPITGYRSKVGHSPTTGKWQITFNVKEGYEDKPVYIPCGRCIGCKLEHSRQWAIRIQHEASLYADNCFLTLTYNEDNLPSDNSLNKTDIQKFFKRLRKKYGEKIRYFQCGEYGDKNERPHHHVCLFNFDFKDKILWTTRKGFKYYVSESLEKLWGKGNCLVTDLTFESAAYTARYCTKKITGKDADAHYGGRLPEYVTMSRRSGIGKEYWQRFKKDIIVGDSVVVRKDLICKPAKYYDSLYDNESPLKFKEVKKNRLKKLKENQEDDDWRRLADKEQVKLNKFKQLKRSYESGTSNLCNP